MTKQGKLTVEEFQMCIDALERPSWVRNKLAKAFRALEKDYWEAQTIREIAKEREELCRT